jgi:ribulose-bisphosphate carboxylase large chain
MTPEERQGFFAEETALDLEEHVIETYWFETGGDPRDAAASLCQEKSTAQWKRPGVDEDFRPQFAAKVIGLDVVDESSTPSFRAPFVTGEKFYRCVVRIAHPYRNFGAKIPNLLTAVAGEGAFFCHHISAIKLIDIAFPPSYVDKFEGPRFGTEGWRKLLSVPDRPIFFGVVKPNIGLDTDTFANIAFESWMGGLDVAKDDEMLADTSWSPLKLRAMRVGRMRAEAEQKTGKPKIYLANITDEVDRLCELHDIAVAAGANAVMVNGVTTGLSAIRMLRRHAEVPIVAHFDMIAACSRLPFFGVATTVFSKLQRMVGFDAIIMPGFGSRMMTAEDEVLANCASCSEPMGHMERSLPVPGGSDWAGTLGPMLEKMGTIDFGMVPGRGVFGHPMGPRAGAKSLHQAWEAYLAKASVEEYAETHPELAAAIEAFGGRTTDEADRHDYHRDGAVEHQLDRAR